MFTIDDHRTKDIDDAIEVADMSDGTWFIKVAIADVGSEVTPGSRFDQQAKAKGASRYTATSTHSMLPYWLSENKLSLWPSRRKNCLGLVMNLSKDLEVTSKEMALVTIESQAKLTYDEIPTILADPQHPQHTQIVAARKLALGLLAKRRAAGAMVFYDLNNGWVTTEDGFLKKLKDHNATIGYIIIQELMILANVEVATLAVERNIPILFRNHEARAAAPDREAIVRQIAEAVTSPIQDLEALQKRTHILFDRAKYSPTLLGHYGLNVAAYTHFTSPIRRYADLVVHQQLRAHLKGLPLPYTQEDLEETADYLNTLAQTQREADAEAFKERAEARVTAQLDTGNAEGLSDSAFERFVKMEVRSGNPPSQVFTDEWHRRVAAGKVSLLCFTEVITYLSGGPEWKPIRQAAVGALRSHESMSVLTYAATPAVAGWPVVKYTTGREGPAHAPSFTTTAVLHLPEVGRDLQATAFTKNGGTSKQTKQQAALALLHRIVRLDEPEDLRPIEIATEAKVVAPTGKLKKSDLNKHPVSVLMERAQADDLSVPTFEFEASGPAHQPAIVCKASFMGHTVEATSSNKQAAKEQAARALLEKIA